MMWPVALMTSLLLAGQVSGSKIMEVTSGIRRDDMTERIARRLVNSLVEADDVERRDTAVNTTSSNATSWDSATSAACVSALTNLPASATNPSGMALCYNLPSLDNTTGVFQADLRIYKVSEPTGDFANISAANVEVGLSYADTTVSPVNSSTMQKRTDGFSLISWPSIRSEESGIAKRTVNNVTLVETYAFVGKINSDKLVTDMNAQALRNVLSPQVTLSTKADNGSTISTVLPMDPAEFLTGKLSKAVSTTSIPSNVFVLPGTRLLIIPIGAIITGAWTLLFTATLMYGTLGRINFRAQYRMRSTRAAKGVQKFI